VSAPFAHVGGLPLEESLPALAPAVAAVAYLARGVLVWLKRR
jgi:hypothetical protein